MHKKILVWLLSFVVALAGMAPMGYAEAVSPAAEPMPEVALLTTLGIISGYVDGSYGLEQTITRAELMTMAMRALNIRPAEVHDKQLYADVPQTHWAIKAINVATDLGFVKGDGQNHFYPDAPVTGAEALKVCVNLLGCAEKAELSGGFPAGYMTVANEIGLLDGVVLQGQGITRGEVIAIFARMLETDITRRVYANIDYMTFEVVAGMSLLKSKHDIDIVEGQLDGVNRMTVYNTPVSDKITVDGMVYTASCSIPDDLFCKRVKVYYKTAENGVRNILHIAVKKQVTELLVDDDSDLRYSNFTYYYKTDRGREASVPLDKNVNIILNGRPAGLDQSKYIPQNGTVRFIDNNSDGLYDAAIIRSYENYYVGTIDKGRDRIYDKYVPGKYLDITGYNAGGGMILVNNEGKLISPNLLFSNQVISVYASADGQLVYAEAQSLTRTGKVEQIDQTGLDTIVVDGTTYTLRIPYGQMPELGTVIKMYFDPLNRVVSFEKQTEGNLFGYVIAYDNASELDGTVLLKLLDHTGEIRLIKLAQNVVVDRISGLKGMALKKAVETGITQGAVVKYSLNQSGEIRTLDTAYRSGEEDDTSMTPIYSSGKSTVRFKQTTNGFGETVYIGADTVVFTIDDAGTTEKQKYAIMDSLTNDGYYIIESFSDDAEKYIVPDVIVVYADNSKQVVTSRALYVITGIAELMEDDLCYDAIYVSNGNEPIAYKLIEENAVKKLDLACGDVVRFDKTADNAIKRGHIQKIYDYDQKKQVGGITINFNDVFRVLTGYVADKHKDGYLVVKENLNDQAYIALNAVGISPIVVSEQRGKLQVKTGNFNDVIDSANAGNDCSLVLIQTYYATVSQIIVLQ